MPKIIFTYELELEQEIEDYTEDIVWDIIRALEDILKDARMNWFEMLGLLKYHEEDSDTLRMSEKELAIINFEGSQGSYGHIIIDSKNIEKVEDIVIREKEENDAYSLDSCFNRIEKEGIKIYDSEYYRIDFGM
jgi:hypothetical protein